MNESPTLFSQQWLKNFPNTVPISYLFKSYFFSDWFRIHSLPKSKRYPETQQEIGLLLQRQNQIITDCLPQNTSIFLVSGHYFYQQSDRHVNNQSFKSLPYCFTPSACFNLHQEDPKNFYEDDEQFLFEPLVTHVQWKPDVHNDLLLKIANNQFQAFFICFEKNIIVAPYDGGIDFIIQDQNVKEFLKEKYHFMLSPRADGL